jgi:hypothetical protein
MNNFSAISWWEQVTFNERIMIMSALYLTNMLSWIIKVLAHWNNSLWIDRSIHLDTLSPPWYSWKIIHLALSKYNLLNLYVSESGVGAGIDSYYEYVLKAYILLGDDEYLDRFNKVSSWIFKLIFFVCFVLDQHA